MISIYLNEELNLEFTGIFTKILAEIYFHQRSIFKKKSFVIITN